MPPFGKSPARGRPGCRPLENPRLFPQPAPAERAAGAFGQRVFHVQLAGRSGGSGRSSFPGYTSPAACRVRPATGLRPGTRIPARAAAMQMGFTYFNGILALNTLCFINILLIGPGAGPTALNRPSLHCKYGPGGGKICPVRPSQVSFSFSG